MIIHRSQRVEVLAERLAEVLAVPDPDPLVPEVVVVQSTGMSRWLEFQLAQRLPVCAHLDWPSPAKFVHDCFERILGPGRLELEGWSTERLTWAVAATLPGRLADPEFAAVAGYLAGGARWQGPEPPGAWSRKAMLLAQQVGRAFARYVRYRPELVAEWERGEGAGWQPVLWRDVRARVGVPHLGDVARGFSERLASGTATDGGTKPLPKRVCLFGLTTLPPLYLAALRSLAGTVKVHVFALAPGRPGPVTHPLYASCGRLFADLDQPLSEAAEVHDVFPGTDRSTLLRAVQADLVEGPVRSFEATPSGAGEGEGADPTVQVHACHGSMRQVEVLRDALVEAFEAVPDLEPRDVVVMTPDIDTYAPLVHAVFADRAPGVPQLPFRVADRTMRHHNRVAEALLTMLGMVAGRAEVSAVLDLFAAEPVRMRFGVEVEELPRLRQWVAESGVRWGIDAAHRVAHGQSEDPAHTWRAGLDRLLLGRAMAGEGLHLFGDTLPYDDVQGRDSLLLGRLVDYVETLFEHFAALPAPRPMAGWATALGEALDALFARRDSEAWQHLELREIFAALEADAQAVRMAGDITLDAVRALLEARLDDRSAPTGFLTGAVTFCELVPMRSIPFRVVCLLGMDDGAFPRSVTRPSFDLVDHERRAGDRSRRDDDRALFLEAVMAARDRLVVTYSGRDIRGNKAQAPAVPVGELLDVLVDMCGADRAQLVRTHPLQAFSPRNFAVGAPRAYDRGALKAARALAQPLRVPTPTLFPTGETLPPGAPAPIEIDRLCSFLQGPAKALLGRRLGLWLRDDEDPVRDDRPLDLDGLARWRVGDELLKLQLRHAQADPGAGWLDVFEPFRVSGQLPPGPPGRELYDQLVGGVRALVDRVQALRAGPRFAPIDVDLVVPAQCFEPGAGEVRLVGRVSDLFPGGRVRHQYSRIKAKHQVAAWVRHLVLHVHTGAPGDSYVVGRPDRGGGVRVVRWGPLSVADAQAHLVTLLKMYREGQRAAVPFFPSSSRAWAERRAKPDQAEQAAARMWPTDRDAYVDRAFCLGETPPHATGLRAAFIAHAEAVWVPVLAAEGRG